MSFRILGLDPAPFKPLFALDDEALQSVPAIRVRADDDAMPCRVSLGHAPVGDELLLLNYEHQPAPTPYRSRHAIYVSRSARDRYDRVDEIPVAIATRLVSVRAFDEAHLMIDADVVEGAKAAPLFERLLALPGASYLHVHFARRGCYAARVERA